LAQFSRLQLVVSMSGTPILKCTACDRTFCFRPDDAMCATTVPMQQPIDQPRDATTVAMQQHIDQLPDATTVAMQQHTDQLCSSTSTSYAMPQHIEQLLVMLGKQMEDNKKQNECNHEQTNQIQMMLDTKRGSDSLVGLGWEFVKDSLWDWAKNLAVCALPVAVVGCAQLLVGCARWCQDEIDWLGTGTTVGKAINSFLVLFR